MNVFIKRPGETDPVASFKADKTTVFTHALMGEHKISASFKKSEALSLQINDYIEYNGEEFTINQPIEDARESSRMFEYNITFEGPIYKLYDKLLMHLGVAIFEYFGQPADLIQLIVNNMNTISSGWTVGACEDLPPQPVQFNNMSCRVGLTTIADQFKLEFKLTGKAISLVKQVGNTTALVFGYGRGNGLYKLSRKAIADKPLITRAYGFGSTRNIPADYRGGIGRLTFDPGFIDKNVEVYGVKEGIYTNEEIYPKFEGGITAVSTYDADSSVFTITDPTIDFNVKDAILSGVDGKVQFLTGELTGQEFTIVDWNHDTKTVTLKVFVDDKNKKLPNDVFYPAIGDTFNFIDIGMPSSYIEAAEAEAEAATEAFADENGVPNVTYDLDVDILHVKREGFELASGDRITVQDVELGIDKLIRVNSVSYPAFFRDDLEPDSEFKAVIADYITYSVQERIKLDIKSTQKEVKVVNRSNSEKARRIANNLRTLQGRIFNPDGSLFDGVDSLRAGMIQTGYDSQDYSLNAVSIAPNAGADENSLVISAGQLIHRIYKIALGYTWVMASNSWAALDPDKYYYVYAKCSTSALTGTWEISETPVGVNSIAGHFAFNLGVLYEVNADGYREFESTKGVSFIVGDQITTGRVKDLTGQNYFDLTEGSFNLGDTDKGIDYNVTTPDELTIKNAVASKTVKVGDGGTVNAGISGVTDEADESVRFWAGAEEADKNEAPFRVLDNGNMVANQGDIANFKIDGTGLKNTSNTDAYIIQEVKDLLDNIIARAAIGTNIAIGYNFVGDFKNHFDNPSGPNYGVRISVRNGDGSLLEDPYTGNKALDLEGDLAVNDGNLVTGEEAQVYMLGPDVFLAGSLPETGTKAGFGAVMRRNSDGKLFVFYE